MNANDTYLPVNEICKTFGIGRTTFYRMLADPHLGLSELVVRVPPDTGRLKVPRLAFEEWLRGYRSRRASPRRPGARP